LAAAHVFVADVGEPLLDPDDQHHLERVLRLRDGEAVTAADGDGRWRACTWSGGRLEVAGEVVVDDRPSPAVTVAFALTKGDKPELVVQKLTEVGVDRIAPFAAARSVVRWDGAKAARQVERLRRVAREAAMQSRRSFLPAVDDLATFAAVAALPSACLADAGGEPPSLDRPTILVGPEGGWSEEERASGPPAIGLGPHVLRAETAAIVAGALVVAIRTGLCNDHRGSLPPQ
jgi:16S rRNA (uracil1498-N3)-methyltransferase